MLSHKQQCLSNLVALCYKLIQSSVKRNTETVSIFKISDGYFIKSININLKIPDLPYYEYLHYILLPQGAQHIYCNHSRQPHAELCSHSKK